MHTFADFLQDSQLTRQYNPLGSPSRAAEVFNRHGWVLGVYHSFRFNKLLRQCLHLRHRVVPGRNPRFVPGEFILDVLQVPVHRPTGIGREKREAHILRVGRKQLSLFKIIGDIQSVPGIRRGVSAATAAEGNATVREFLLLDNLGCVVS